MRQWSSMIHVTEGLVSQASWMQAIKGHMPLLNASSCAQPHQQQHTAHLSSSSAAAAAARLEPASNPRTLKQGAYPGIAQVMQRIEQTDELLDVYNATLKYRKDVMPPSVVAAALQRASQLHAQRKQQGRQRWQQQSNQQLPVNEGQQIEQQQPEQPELQGGMQDQQQQQPMIHKKPKGVLRLLLGKTEWQLSKLLHAYDGPQLAACACALCTLQTADHVNHALLQRCLNILLDHDAQLLKAAGKVAAMQLASGLHHVHYSEAAHWVALARVLLSVKSQVGTVEDAAQQATAHALQWAAQQVQSDQVLLQAAQAYST